MKVDGLPPRHLDIMMLLTNAEWVHVPLAPIKKDEVLHV